ncbi:MULTISPECIES: hypothetical protein [unclassified Streptomyces]|uniref:hypothetical protein n=1 Tax=unclassified Streptomyces TaxID=2593676 RepID=UPI00403C2C6D
MLKATGAAAVGPASVATLSVDAGEALAHHGLLHTCTDLAIMAAKVKAGAAPYTAGYAKMTANRHAQSGCTARPQAIAFRSTTLRPRRNTCPQNYGTTQQPEEFASHG